MAWKGLRRIRREKRRKRKRRKDFEKNGERVAWVFEWKEKEKAKLIDDFKTLRKERRRKDVGMW